TEDGIRDRNVTGVQTCALPILSPGETSKNNFNFDYFNIIRAEVVPGVIVSPGDTTYYLDSSAQDGGDGKTEATAFESLEDINNKIGRASCRERVERGVEGESGR